MGYRVLNAIFMRGATMWEFQWGRLYITIPFRRFRQVGCRPKVRWMSPDGSYPAYWTWGKDKERPRPRWE